jgi:hypothetical protein
VVKIEKSQLRVSDEGIGDLLTKGGHQAKLRPPFVQEQPEELWRLDPARVDWQIVVIGKSWHEQFVVTGVRIPPEPLFSVRERLMGIVSGHSHQLCAQGERPEN